MLKQFCCFFVICWLTFSCHNLLAQKATNVKIKTTDEQLIIEYDLTGESQSLYEVSLKFKLVDGNYITPKTLRGDIGEVTAGPGKIIVWELYKDINGLSGSVDPEFDVKEVKRNALKPQPTPTPTPPKQDDNRPTIDVNINKVKYSKKALRFGIKWATGNSRVKTQAKKFERKYSWQGGLYFRWNIERKIYLQPELLFHKQAFKEVLSETRVLNHNLHYGRAQVLAGIKPIGFGLYFNAGFYYNRLLGGNQKMSFDGQNKEINFIDLPVQNEEQLPYLKNDLGYILGGTLSINKGAFALGVLYSRGFNNISNSVYWLNDAEKENLTLRNGSIHFFLQKSLIKSKRQNGYKNGFQNVYQNWL